MQIKGKTVLITGAAVRIGAALALMMAKRGANLVLHYFQSEEAILATKSQCETLGAKVTLIKADLSQENDVANVVLKLSDSKTNVDILIHNASIYRKGFLLETQWTDVLENQSIHCLSVLKLSQWFAAQNLSEGLTLTFLDAGLHRYDASHVAYQLSKRSLADLTQMMAIEFAPHVRVNAIAPGPILPASAHSLDWFNKVVSELPIPRAGELNDIMHAAVFLIENNYVTGQIIYCDGGYHLKGKDLR